MSSSLSHLETNGFNISFLYFHIVHFPLLKETFEQSKNIFIGIEK